MKIKEIQEAATLIQEQAHEDANIIFGASIDEQMGEARTSARSRSSSARLANEMSWEASAEVGD